MGRRMAVGGVIYSTCHKRRRGVYDPLGQYGSAAASLWNVGRCHQGKLLWGQLPGTCSPASPLSPHPRSCASSMSPPVRRWGGGGVGMESLVALSGHALCARFCAEHPIFCFLCPHNNPHGTDEETEAHRGEGTCPSSRRWYGKKAGVRTQFFLTPDLPSEQLLLICHD